MADENRQDIGIIELATELTVAWLNNPNNRASADEVPAFLQKMHSTLNGLEAGSVGEPPQEVGQEDYPPAVSVRKSLASPDHILSMIDGKPYKTLRRHLSRHGLTPEQYRERYGLKADYPMVSRNYSETRRAMAHKIGLGSKGRNAARSSSPEDGSPAKPKRTARRKARAQASEPKSTSA